MNKEYDNNNQGSLWKSDYVDKNGNTYYKGILTINNKEVKITMFENKSDNPKVPNFKLYVNTKKEEVKPNEEKTDPFEEFGNNIEITDEDLPF